MMCIYVRNPVEKVVIFIMKDSYGRSIDYMRISVTDRCNLRCRYCMSDDIKPIPKEELLTYEEIVQIVEAAAELGITKIKLTGGEPLVRKDVVTLVRMLHAVPGVREVTMTTNGVLLMERLDELINGGIHAINISIDTLDEKKYEQITGKRELSNIILAVREAAKRGIKVKINTVLLGGTSEEELFQILQIAQDQNIDVRFIELMPIGEGKKMHGISGKEWLMRIKERYPSLQENYQVHGNGPAKYYHISGFAGSVGFISAIHGKFCNTCNRVRLSSTGQLKACLCYEGMRDLKSILRKNGWKDEKEQQERLKLALKEEIAAAIMEKPLEHCFENPDNMTEHQKMVAIGG